jgi:hypothetical protein
VAACFVAIFLNSVPLIYATGFGLPGVSFIVAIVAISLALWVRLRGAWAIVGLVTGITAALLSVLGALTLFFLG